MSKTYILQKDLPDAEIGTILTQEKEGGLYMYRGRFDESEESWYIPEMVENNSKWFKEKEQPKEWEIVLYYHYQTGGVSITPSLHKNDPVNIYSVKNIIGQKFSVGDETNHGVIKSFEIMDSDMYAVYEQESFSIKNLEIRYTQQQLEEAERKAWISARGKIFGNIGYEKQYYYDSFQQYKKENK